MLDRDQQLLTELAKKYGPEKIEKTLKKIDQELSLQKKARGHPPGLRGDAIAIWLAVEIYTRAGALSGAKISKEKAYARIVKTLGVLFPGEYRKGTTVGRVKSLYYEARQRVQASSSEDRAHIESVANDHARSFATLHKPTVLPFITHRVNGRWKAPIHRDRILQLGNVVGMVSTKECGLATLVLYCYRETRS